MNRKIILTYNVVPLKAGKVFIDCPNGIPCPLIID
jgi:hypothetical protein